MHPLAIFGIVLLVLIAIAAAVRYNLARLRRARSAMERTVLDQGLAVASARLCWLPRGPFGRAISAHEPVYRVTVHDPSGRIRRGWVHCHPFSDETESAWED